MTVGVAAALIGGLTDNPTHGMSAEIGTTLTATLTEGAIATVQWSTVEDGPIPGATSVNFVPSAAHDERTLYAVVNDGNGDLTSPTFTVRFAPPVFSTAPSITPATGNVGTIFTLSEGVAVTSSIFLDDFSYGGASRLAEVAANNWDSTGESGGQLITATFRAVNSGGAVTTTVTGQVSLSLGSSGGVADPSWAFGTTAITDYGTMIYIDMFKQSRAMRAELSAGGSLKIYDLIDGGYLDTNGWPLSIPPGTSSRGLHAIFGQDDNPDFSNTTWRLTWDGTGTVAVNGAASSTVIGTNEIEFLVGPSENNVIYIEVRATDPAPNNVRNIKMIRPEQQAIYDAGEIFNPDYVEFVSEARYLRFMNMQDTNHSLLASWSERPTPQLATYCSPSRIDKDAYVLANSATPPVHPAMPVEDLVALANRTNTDPWFCIPHLADVNFIAQFSAYVRDNLNGHLVARFEYSNECWNTGFEQENWLRSLAPTEFPMQTNVYFATWSLYGKKSTEMFDVIDGVYAGSPSVYKKVLATQRGNLGVQGRNLDAPDWDTQDSFYSTVLGKTLGVPHSYADEFAIAGYFSGARAADSAELAAIDAAYPANSDQLLYSYHQDPARATSIPILTAQFQETNDLCAARNLVMSMYEGGTHQLYQQVVSGANSQYANLLPALLQFNESNELATIYEQAFDAWRSMPTADAPYMQFVDVQRWSQYGAWGTIQSFAENTTAKYLKIKSLNETVGNWWGETKDYSNGGAGGSYVIQDFSNNGTGYVAVPANAIADAAALTYSIHLTPNSIVANSSILNFSGSALVLEMTWDRRLRVNINRADVAYDARTASPVLETGQSSHIHLTVDLNAPAITVTVNGVVQPMTVTTALSVPANPVLDLTRQAGLFGNAFGAVLTDVVFGDAYLETGVVRPYNDFVDAQGNPVDLGSLGAPVIHLGGTQSASDINAATNLGSAVLAVGSGDFTTA